MITKTVGLITTLHWELESELINVFKLLDSCGEMFDKNYVHLASHSAWIARYYELETAAGMYSSPYRCAIRSKFSLLSVVFVYPFHASIFVLVYWQSCCMFAGIMTFSSNKKMTRILVRLCEEMCIYKNGNIKLNFVMFKRFKWTWLDNRCCNELASYCQK